MLPSLPPLSAARPCLSPPRPRPPPSPPPPLIGFFPLLLHSSSASSLSAATWKSPAPRHPRPRSWHRSASPGPRCAGSDSTARPHLPVAGPDSTVATRTSASMVSKLVASLVHLLRTGNGQRWRRASEMPEVICGAVDVGRAAPRGGGSAVAPTSPLGSTAIHYHPYPTGDGDMWCGSRRRVIINRRRRGGDTLKASTRRSMGIVGHKWRRRSGGRGGATHSKVHQ